MIPLLPPSLPLLIKEKVEFYYYRQKWLDKIKIMNEQYKPRVIVDSDDNFEVVRIRSFCVVCRKRTNNANEIRMKLRNTNYNVIKCTCTICDKGKMFILRSRGDVIDRIRTEI
jgi:hypothetical protein